MIPISQLLESQLAQVTQWHTQAPESLAASSNSFLDVFQSLVTQQHYENYKLWHQEDLARDPKASDSQIASVKRRIDALNQQRNDLIEQVDAYFLKQLHSQKVILQNSASMNSETLGSILDRLSINALKIYHMDEEVHRSNVAEAHHLKCSQRLQILKQQRKDLGECLENLVNNFESGKQFFKIYQQMKMYNDPTLNPVLYASKPS